MAAVTLCSILNILAFFIKVLTSALPVLCAECKRDGRSRLNRGGKIQWLRLCCILSTDLLRPSVRTFVQINFPASPTDSAMTVVSSVTRTQCFVKPLPPPHLDVSPRLYSSTFHQVWRISSVSPLMWICLRTHSLISLNGQSRAHGTARCIFLKMYFFIFLNYFCLWSSSSCGTVKTVKLALMLCNCCTLFNVNLRTKKIIWNGLFTHSWLDWNHMFVPTHCCIDSLCSLMSLL